MTYLLIIAEPRGQRAAWAADEARLRHDEMTAYASELRERGVLLRAEALADDAEAVRISTPAFDQRAQLVEGPFAEAADMVSGFFLIDAESADDAVAIARDCPAVRWATVEVRECTPWHLPHES